MRGLLKHLHSERQAIAALAAVAMLAQLVLLASGLASQALAETIRAQGGIVVCTEVGMVIVEGQRFGSYRHEDGTLDASALLAVKAFPLAWSPQALEVPPVAASRLAVARNTPHPPCPDLTHDAQQPGNGPPPGRGPPV